MNRIQRSIELAKQSWKVLRGNPSLAIFPIISSIATLLVSIPFMIPIALLVMGRDHQQLNPDSFKVTTSVLGFLMYVATYTVIIFFNSALVTCAHKNLRGEQTSVGEGIGNALRHLPQILGWALIAATVGQVLKAVQEKGGLIGAILGGLVGVAWNIAVFFVVPIMVIENEGPITALKSSAERLKKTWGEQLIGGGGLGFVMFLMIVLPCIAFVAIGVVLLTQNVMPGLAFFVLALVWALVGSVVMSCMNVIYQTALYEYSRTGQIPSGFSQNSIALAFAQKQSR